VHAYVVENWRRQPILLNLERVVDKNTSNNLTIIIVCFLINLGGLSVVDVTNMVVCFGANGVTVFQGLKTCVTFQLIMNKHSPFIVGIHCMAHRWNLVVQIFSSLSLVVKIEALLSTTYTYYNQSPKRHFEHPKLVEMIESKGLIFLKNIKMK